jgi:hypothetical protein
MDARDRPTADLESGGALARALLWIIEPALALRERRLAARWPSPDESAALISRATLATASVARATAAEGPRTPVAAGSVPLSQAGDRCPQGAVADLVSSSERLP